MGNKTRVRDHAPGAGRLVSVSLDGLVAPIDESGDRVAAGDLAHAITRLKQERSDGRTG